MSAEPNAGDTYLSFDGTGYVETPSLSAYSVGSEDTIRNYRPTFVSDTEPAMKRPTLDRQYWLAPRTTSMIFSLKVTVRNSKHSSFCRDSAATSQIQDGGPDRRRQAVPVHEKLP